MGMEFCHSECTASTRRCWLAVAMYARLFIGLCQLHRSLTQLTHERCAHNTRRWCSARDSASAIRGAPHAALPGELEAQHRLRQHRQAAGLLLRVAQPALPVRPHRLQRLQPQDRVRSRRHTLIDWP